MPTSRSDLVSSGNLLTEIKMQFDEPMDRLTRIGGRLLDAARVDPEYREGDKVIVLTEDENALGGIAYHGYPEGQEGDVVQDLFYRLYIIAKANGLDLQFIGIEERGRG